MKRLSLFSIGALTAILPAGIAFAQSSAPATFYDRIKDTVDEELTKDLVEPEIADFISAYYKDAGETVSREDVTIAMKGDKSALCNKRDPSDTFYTAAGCSLLINTVRKLVPQERFIRTLGRSLQLGAAGQEIPVADVPGRALSIASDLRGIVNIWAAGTGSVKSETGTLLRTKNIDAATIEPLLKKVGEELNKLSEEEKIAAVWRYLYGHRLVLDQRKPEYPAPYKDDKSGPGTERQYYFKQWPALETALKNVWNEVRNQTFTPPLSPGESAIILFPKDAMKQALPDNMLLWARVDGGPRYPLGDVGLQWKIPLEPVLPSLVADNGSAILGGEYPPEPVDDQGKPVDGRGLCSDPLAARGYLCRSFAPAEGERCPDDPNNPRDPNAITLTLCTDPKPPRTTIAGPDVCRGIPYTDSKTFDPQTQCRIGLRCAQSCSQQQGITASTSLKDANGNISICLSSDNGLNYLLYHELHHAYQLCTLPPSDKKDPYAGLSVADASRLCCSFEGEAFRAQCDLMELDGVFTTSTGAALVVGGIPINAETCSEYLTDWECRGAVSGGGGCYTSRTYTPAFQSALTEAHKNNPKNVPTVCKDIIDPKKMDVRVKDLMDAVTKRNDVCRPGYVETYKNRIGNNLCYIGQCIEESAEMHRLTGTQSPATVGDASNPWDDPTTGTALGNAVTSPPISAVPLPSYRPQLVLAQFEQALCASAGRPPLVPSILCTFDISQRLLQPIAGRVEQTQSLITGQQAQANTTENFLTLSRALGVRMGTDLYSDYLRNASRSLSDLLSTAVKLFHDMDSLSFPTEMCPLDNRLPTPSSAANSNP